MKFRTLIVDPEIRKKTKSTLEEYLIKIFWLTKKKHNDEPTLPRNVNRENLVNRCVLLN